jgi:uncharacterized protein
MAWRRTSIESPSLGLKDRYGAWALVAGASQGLGAAYSHLLGRQGLNLILAARRAELLESLAGEIRDTCGVAVHPYPGDLADPTFVESLTAACSSVDLGLIVYNATQAPVGDFVSTPAAELVRVVDVNLRAPLLLLRSLLPRMASRGRGGVVLMTSLAGNQGAPRLAAYASSKAFMRVLGESLWAELKERHVDVVACCAGAVRTPGYQMAAGKDAPGTLDPHEVALQALQALGRRPVVIPGFVNRLANVVMGRLLPRQTAIAIMGGNTSDLSPATPPAPVEPDTRAKAAPTKGTQEPL